MIRAPHEQADELELAIARLPTVDLDLVAARAHCLAAEQRLRSDQRAPRSRLERSEPALLIAMASLHLLWTVARLLSP